MLSLQCVAINVSTTLHCNNLRKIKNIVIYNAMIIFAMMYRDNKCQYRPALACV